MQTHILSFSVTLKSRTCPNCSGVYAISQEYEEEAMRLGEFKKMWTCPYCKEERGFGEGRIQKLEKELRASQSREQLERDQRHAAERSAEGERIARLESESKRAKMEKRIKNGVCPCCKRSFCNLQKHIATKHPEFAKK